MFSKNYIIAQRNTSDEMSEMKSKVSDLLLSMAGKLQSLESLKKSILQKAFGGKM
jgi:type IV secretory pathway VirD2 relaxase